VQIRNKIRKIFEPRLKLVKGTRFQSFLFIALSLGIAAGILFGANIYYNLDTGEIVMQEIQRVTSVIRATGGLIVGGTATQNPSPGYVFEVVGKSKLATTTISTAGQLEFTGATGSAAFIAPSDYGTTTQIVYILPKHGTNPPQDNYVLTWTTGNQLKWQSVSGVGAGDITAVGDCASGDCFTSSGGSGNSLWFITGGGGRIQLTGTSTASNYTITLPAASGSVVLGSGTANYAVYWSGANTLAAEQYLSVSRGGTGAGSFTQYGIIYGNGTGALQVTGAGSTNQLLVSGGGTSAPTWKNIGDLITATNGVTTTGTTLLTIKLGGNLSENTTLNLANYNLLFNLASGGTAEKFAVQVDGTDILKVGDDGTIYFKTYPLAQTGKDILVGMIPILGFDLPIQTATTNYAKISRTISVCNFPSTPAGATRVYKFVIRYTDDLPTASTTSWRVATTTGAAYSTFTLEGSNNAALDSGQTRIKEPTGGVPCDTYPWWVEVNPNPSGSGKTIKVFEIFLAAFDRLQ
jgi:hypothetical protein